MVNVVLGDVKLFTAVPLETIGDRTHIGHYLTIGYKAEENYPDPDTYKLQLPATPVEFQNVYYTDAEPVYLTNDPFWLAYDENWLVVYPWSAGVGLYKYRTNLKLNLALEL